MTGRRGYTSPERARTKAITRARILAAARELIPNADASLPVTTIARHAGVAVQTIYDQFGSKGGLLIAVIGDVQESAGLFRAFPSVFSSPHGEEAMRRMIDATVRLWHEAWPFLAFILRAERTDPVVRDEMAFVDTLRHAHFWAITRRLEQEGRIPRGHDAAWAADVSFALTIPTVYEELAVRRGLALDAVRDTVSDAVVGIIVDPETPPRSDPPPDWPSLEAEAADRARAAGADPARLSPEWRGAAARTGAAPPRA